MVGVACDCLNELIEKGRKKLSICAKEEVTIALDDGTIVDDESYFLQLPAQTVLIFYLRNEEIETGTFG